MAELLNDVVLSEEIVNALFSMDKEVVKACDEKAKEICKKLFPEIDVNREENIDLVIRPMSATIALNELLLQNIYEMSSIDGIYNSKTIPSKLKIGLLRNFAILNGMEPKSNSIEALYSEIKFTLYSRNQGNERYVTEILKQDNSNINRLLFVDFNQREMVRNKISYIQINHRDTMTFERSKYNPATLIDTAYNRSDYQRYLEYKKSEKIEMPGVLDVYFSTPLSVETVKIKKRGEYYILPSGYYISIEHKEKDFVILEDDKRRWGIVQTTPKIFMPNGDDEETFTITSYQGINFPEEIKSDAFPMLDVLFKGFYPIFVDFTVYTKEKVNAERIKNSISEYLDTIDGDMTLISHNDLNDYIRKRGDMVVVASTNNSRGFTSLNTMFETKITFPITMKDINIPKEIRNPSISERTIRIFVGGINVVYE